MQSTVAALLLVTSAVVLACVVVDYAVVVFQETLQSNSLPQLEQLKDAQNTLLNQTESLFNQTQLPPQNIEPQP
jgi:hypothetical protein